MEKDKKIFDTVSDMSVQDVLDEINAEAYQLDEGDLILEDVLAEFSNVAESNSKKEELKTAEKEKPIILKKSKQTVSEDTFENIDDTKDNVKMVDTIVRPWENGVYGDMRLQEERAESVKKEKKRKRNATLSETFDTFTRSELFEEKIQEEPLETRSVEEIIKENRMLSKLLGLRTVALLVLSILSCYLAFAMPLKWYIPRFISYVAHPFRYLFLTAFLQVIAMLLSVDVISRGLSRLFTFRPNADSAIAFSAFASLIHVLTIIIAPHWRGWLPYSSISVLTLFFAIYSKWMYIRAICRVCKTVKSAKFPSAVHIVKRYDEINIIKKVTDDTTSFISHINDRDAARIFWSYLSPIVIVASLVFAFISSVGTGTPEHFFWALAAISSVSTPFFMTLCFIHPFAATQKKLSLIGAAISGWFSAVNLSKKSANVIVCDEDVFPKGTITLHGLRVLGTFSLEQTVCYTASIISETKSGLSGVFSDLLKSRYQQTIHVKNMQYHEDGGLEAQIGEDNVLVGTAGFILRSGVRLTSGTTAKNAVFVAINREPAGVFNVNYKANIEVERALHIMVKKKVPVVLAVRDFNLLPTMVEGTFNLRDSSLEYPEIEDRIDLSSEEQFIDTDASAIITRSGLYPFSESVISAKKLRSVTIRNIILTCIGTMIGMLLMFYLTFMQRPVLIPPHTVFVYMMMWMIPTYLLSARVKK